MEKKEQKNNKTLLIVLIVLAVVIIGLLLFLLLRPRAEGQSFFSIGDGNIPLAAGLEMDANSEEGGLVYRSQEEIQEELNRKVAEGMINISMNTNPVFPSGTEPGNLLIVNSNINNYPQIVYIVRKDTGEEIYRSKGIAVGSKIEYAPLSVALPAGEYECVAYFNNADPQTGAILGTAGAEITITVQS